MSIHGLLTDLSEILASTTSHLVDSKDQVLSEMEVSAQWLSVLPINVLTKFVPSVPLRLHKKNNSKKVKKAISEFTKI